MYLTGLRDICRFMAAREAGGGAAGLTRAVLAEYWMQAGLKRETGDPPDACWASPMTWQAP